MGLEKGGRLLSLSGLHDSSQGPPRWAEINHTERLLRKSSMELGTHLTWTNQPRENTAADALPRRSTAVSNLGVQVLPPPTQGSAHTWMPPGRDQVTSQWGVAEGRLPMRVGMGREVHASELMGCREAGYAGC